MKSHMQTEGFTSAEQDEILGELGKHGFDCGRYLGAIGRLGLLCDGHIEAPGYKYGWYALPVIEIEKQKQEGVISYTLTWIPPVYQINGEIFDNKIVISGVKPGEMGKTLERLLGDIDLIPRRQLPLAEPVKEDWLTKVAAYISRV